MHVNDADINIYGISWKILAEKVVHVPYASRGMSTAGWRHASPRPQLHCREGPVPDAAVCSQLRLGRPPDHTEPVGSCQCPADCPVPLAASHQPRNCFAEFRTLSTKPPISNFPLLKSASNLSQFSLSKFPKQHFQMKCRLTSSGSGLGGASAWRSGASDTAEQGVIGAPQAGDATA